MSSEHEKTIRVGSRKSELALIQTKHVIARLQEQERYRTKKFEIHTMSTIGDRVLNISLPKIGEKSLFTRDLEDCLRNGAVDFVVHSLKDLPTALPTGMAIGAVLQRDDARDALVLRDELQRTCSALSELPPGSVIGTSSLRRTAQIRRQYPHLVVCDIRGNLNTRLAKLDAPDSKYAGIILAQAGLVRMGWTSRVSAVLEPTELLYAVGQGALAVECRANDGEILEMLQSLICLKTTCRILAERSFLKTLGGGCSAPVAVWSKLHSAAAALDANGNDEATEKSAANLSLIGAVWSLDGETEIRNQMACSLTTKTQGKPFAVNNNNNNNNAQKRNGDDEDDESNSNSSSSNGQPPAKRARSASSSPSRQSQDSPPVINDDAEVEDMSATYDMQQLIEKHIDLAKKCPVVGNVEHLNGGAGGDNNGNITHGAGDAESTNSVAGEQHCPLQIDVGQDFMGQCPFVSNEIKVSLASVGKCPLTKDPTAAVVAVATAVDETDRAAAPSTSKCPFTSLHKINGGAGDFVASKSAADGATHSKCPFLQKTVEMFDYADEEKPLPKVAGVLIEDVDNLFCGLFQHTCHKRELYVRSNRLGQQLAEELIKKGALDVMKCAQAEIHSKA